MLAGRRGPPIDVRTLVGEQRGMALRADDVGNGVAEPIGAVRVADSPDPPHRIVCHPTRLRFTPQSGDRLRQTDPLRIALTGRRPDRFDLVDGPTVTIEGH